MPRNTSSAKKRDHARDDDRDDQQADITITDVGELMAEHGFEFGIVEACHQARGDGDRVLLLVEARCEGIERIRLHHLELRHRDAARDAKILEEIIETRVFLPRHLAASGHRIDHPLIELVGDGDPRQRSERHPRQSLDERAARVQQEPVQTGIAIDRDLGHESARAGHQVDKKKQPDDQGDGTAPVCLDVSIETVGHSHSSLVQAKARRVEGRPSPFT